MAYLDFKRCVWLVVLLNNTDGATYKEIADAWEDEPVLNPEGRTLPSRTFYNHMEAIREVFDISIKRTPSDGKYRIEIGKGTYSGRMQRTLMSTLSLSNAADRYKHASNTFMRMLHFGRNKQ